MYVCVYVIFGRSTRYRGEYASDADSADSRSRCKYRKDKVRTWGEEETAEARRSAVSCLLRAYARMYACACRDNRTVNRKDLD